MIPKSYAILRAVRNDSRAKIAFPDQPFQVWTLLDEAGFLARGLLHNQTAFMEDRLHDWMWEDGFFRFYGHSGAPGELHDLALVLDPPAPRS